MSNNRGSDSNHKADTDANQRPSRKYLEDEYPDSEEIVPSVRRRRSQRRQRGSEDIDDRATTRVDRLTDSYLSEEDIYAVEPEPVRRTGRSSPPTAYGEDADYEGGVPRRQGRTTRTRTAARVEEEVLAAEAPRRAGRSGRSRAAEHEDGFEEDPAPTRRHGRTAPDEAPAHAEEDQQEAPARGRSGGRGRDARDAYDDDPPRPVPRYQREDDYGDPYDDYEDEPYDDEDHRPRRGLWIFLIIVVVLVLAVVGLSFLFPAQRDEVLTRAEDLIQGLMGGNDEEAALAALHIDSFTVDDQVAEVGEPMVFTLITNSEVDRIRLQNATGESLAEFPGTDGATVYADGDTRIWSLPVSFSVPYSGVVDAMAGTDTAWADKALYTLNVQVTAVVEPEPTPAVLEIVETPVPLVTITPTPPPTAEPTAAPTPTPVPYIVSVANPIADALPATLGLTSYIVKDDAKAETLARTAPVSMGNPVEYAAQGGVLTFRSGPMRQNAAFGTVEIVDKKMEILWSNRTGVVDTYTGIAFPGQPLIVKWHGEIREMMNIVEEKKSITALKEVIFAAMDGKIYFFDLDDGVPTRDPIDIGFPLRGTPSVDPRGYPILYAGQSLSKLKDTTGTIGLRIFNLLDQSAMYLESGRNKNAPLQNYGAVDGSPVVEATSDTLIYAGENGLLYTLQLDTNFNYETGELSVSPNTIAYGYEVPKKKEVSIEASVAVYGNYAYIVDGAGTLQCVDMNTMTPVWVADVTDNTDSTAALEIEPDGSVALYTACSVLNQKGSERAARMRKFDALTGRLIWEVDMASKKSGDNPGGVMASPIVGEGNINDLVIFTVTGLEEELGKVVALDKTSGDIVWEEILDASTWSSPVAIYAADGTSYIIQGDDTGKLRLMDGFTGSTESDLQLEGPVQGSPAVYGNMMVVGTTDARMYGIRLQ